MDTHHHHHRYVTKELALDHDLHDGEKTKAAVLLLHEFEKDPKQALALVQRELKRQGQCANNDKLHLGVQANGDVIVWDQGEKNGYYAGNIPSELRQRQEAPATQQVDRAAAAKSDIEVSSLPPAVKPAEAQAQGPQSYEYQQPRHRSFHVPFPIDVGVKDGTLHLGLNVLGLAKGGIMLGAQNRGYVGSDALKSEVSAGVDLNEKHIGPAADWHVLGDSLTTGKARVGITPGRDIANLGAGVDATALGKAVITGGHAGVEIGQRLGPHADGYGYVGPAGANVEGHANLSDEGLKAGTTADVGAQPYVGVHGEGRFGLGKNNELHGDVGTNIGDNGASAGAGIYPQFRPDAYVRGYSGDDEAGAGLVPLRAWSRENGSDR